ncbi:MAG TPA: hypothetical protein VL490_11640 [Mucilaginibacter sp.]|jgi:hypothetical protein|nr:hypothetical protein [Mucilaginibacter sp.]
MHVNTIKSADAKETTKIGLVQMMNHMQDQIKFPTKALVVGESFTQDAPINMPTGHMNMGVKAKTTYKLTAVKGNLAFFDTKVDMAFGGDIAKTGKTMTGNGTGSGKMVYNIAENNFITLNNILDMKYSMEMPGKPMEVKMKMVMAMKNDIGK